MSDQYERRKVCAAIMKAESEEEIEKILVENEKWAWAKYDRKMEEWERKANKRRRWLGLPEVDYGI